MKHKRPIEWGFKISAQVQQSDFNIYIYIYIADACFTFPFFLVSITFPVTHVQDLTINVSEILALRTINVNKGKFTLEIGPLKGQTHALNTRAHCTIIHDTTTVKGARLPLFWILSD